MAGRAMFGKPVGDLASGGALITTHVVPVFQGKLVIFDLESSAVSGRWLPWTTMEYGENPYVTASAIVDEWCQGAIKELRLVDVMSNQIDSGVWELAIVFRAELSASPLPTPERTPTSVAPREAGRVGHFDQVDLERWVGMPPDAAPSEKLIF